MCPLMNQSFKASCTAEALCHGTNMPGVFSPLQLLISHYEKVCHQSQSPVFCFWYSLGWQSNPQPLRAVELGLSHGGLLRQHLQVLPGGGSWIRLDQSGQELNFLAWGHQQLPVEPCKPGVYLIPETLEVGSKETFHKVGEGTPGYIKD